MKKVLIVKDPELEVGFEVLCNYCATVQERMGSDVIVLPLWPHGEVELIGDKRQMKLIVKELDEILDEFKLKLEK